MVPVLSEKNVPRAGGVVTAVALWAMTLLAVPHHIDTLTVWTMDQYIGHSVLLWGPWQMDHSTSMSTHLEHHPGRVTSYGGKSLTDFFPMVP